MSDPVNHPAHYTAHPSGVECIDVVEHMSFNVGNAIKYLWRAGQKGDLVEDLRKAAWYIDREIQRIGRLATGGLIKDGGPALIGERAPMSYRHFSADLPRDWFVRSLPDRIEIVHRSCDCTYTMPPDGSDWASAWEFVTWHACLDGPTAKGAEAAKPLRRATSVDLRPGMASPEEIAAQISQRLGGKESRA